MPLFLSTQKNGMVSDTASEILQSLLGGEPRNPSPHAKAKLHGQNIHQCSCFGAPTLDESVAKEKEALARMGMRWWREKSRQRGMWPALLAKGVRALAGALAGAVGELHAEQDQLLLFGIRGVGHFEGRAACTGGSGPGVRLGGGLEGANAGLREEEDGARALPRQPLKPRASDWLEKTKVSR